jgi:hypothetical protein
MREQYDVLRSWARYLAVALATLDPDADWDVRLAEEQGTFERPFCMAYRAAPVSTRSANRYRADVSGLYGALLYPEPLGDAHESLERAERAAGAVERAFREGVGLGWPQRVPLYDYAAVGGSATTDRRAYCDYLRLSDLTIDRQPDDDDETLHTVTVSARLGYAARGRIPSHEHVLQDVRVGWSP